MLKKILALVLFPISLTTYADTGYIFVSVRGAFAYPTEACFGMLAANAQKICNTEYNTDYGFFLRYD